MERLKDKVAIITGGAGGIGKSTAKLFLKEGAKVMLVDISESKLIATAKEFDNPKVSYCVADVSSVLETESYSSKTISEFGKIDIFFNNAGIEEEPSPMTECPENIFDQIIAINLKGVWLGCKYVIPRMNDGGSVIITSSVAGLKGFSGLGAYAASKHGTVGIMRTAALEFAARNIRVNSIHPGPVNTRIMRYIEKDFSPDAPNEVKKWFGGTTPFGRYAEPIEIARLVVFLASLESKYITGTTQVIDAV
jgi:NAD(P)-dependent dehydrogenase (short-subunit alcohol dehydrogenase family)